MTCAVEKLRKATHARSPMRKAWQNKDRDVFFEEVKQRCSITATDCWNWLGRTDAVGYPVICYDKMWYPVHRMVVVMKYGRQLGTQQAHHICANPRCCNPMHLMPETQVANTGEMLQRTSMVRRIAELERALAELDPSNPLLDRIPYGTAA